MSQFELFEPLQSAYKARHNILRAMGQGKVGILLLLDMSATFETVGHVAVGQAAHRAGHWGQCTGLVCGQTPGPVFMSRS